MAKRIRVGNIYGITLPNGKYAFGRMMLECSIVIYGYIGDSINDLPQNEKYQFIVGIYRPDINKDLKYLDYKPFENTQEEWPPPSYIYDVISGGYKLYYRGIITTSSFKEYKGKEATAAWHSNHIIDRILGDKNWSGPLENHFETCNIICVQINNRSRKPTIYQYLCVGICSNPVCASSTVEAY